MAQKFMISVARTNARNHYINLRIALYMMPLDIVHECTKYVIHCLQLNLRTYNIMQIIDDIQLAGIARSIWSDEPEKIFINICANRTFFDDFTIIGVSESAEFRIDYRYKWMVRPDNCCDRELHNTRALFNKIIKMATNYTEDEWGVNIQGLESM